MTQFKTIEHMFIDSYNKLKEELALALKENETFKNTTEEVLVKEKSKEYLIIDKNGKPFYKVEYLSDYYIGDLLKENNKDLDYAKQALQSDRVFNILSKMKRGNYSSSAGYSIRAFSYLYKMSLMDNEYYIIIRYDNELDMFYNDRSTFEDETSAVAFGKKMFRESLQTYVNKETEKFKKQQEEMLKATKSESK